MATRGSARLLLPRLRSPARRSRGRRRGHDHRVGDPLLGRRQPRAWRVAAVSHEQTQAFAALLLVGLMVEFTVERTSFDSLPLAQAMGRTSLGWRLDTMLRTAYSSLSDEDKSTVQELLEP